MVIRYGYRGHSVYLVDFCKVLVIESGMCLVLTALTTQLY